MAPERVLVRLPNWLGDLMLARPLLHALRAACPRAELRAVGPAPLLELIAGDRVADALEPWPAGTPERACLARALRGWRPDAALVLPPSFSSALFAWRTGAPRRIGFSGEGRRPLLTDPLRRPPRGDRHLSDEYLALGARLGAGAARSLPALASPAAGAADARDALAGTPAAAGRGYAVLGPGAAYGPAKRWGVSRFAAAGRALAERGLAVVACGTAAERDECEAVARELGAAGASLAGATGLAALAHVLAGAAVAVCNDSGLAHLAAALGTPTVAVFGSTSSAWTAPLGPRVRIVQRPPVCSPCFRRTCAIGYRCLEAVEAHEVVRACAAMLDGRAAA